jgi:hypothetical protein
MTDQLYITMTDLTLPLAGESAEQGISNYQLAQHKVYDAGSAVYASELAEGFASDLLEPCADEEEFELKKAQLLDGAPVSESFVVNSA